MQPSTLRNRACSLWNTNGCTLLRGHFWLIIQNFVNQLELLHYVSSTDANIFVLRLVWTLIFSLQKELNISHFLKSLQFLFDLNMLNMSGYVTSITKKMLIKLLQLRLYLINHYITFCNVGWHDLQIKYLLAPFQAWTYHCHLHPLQAANCCRNSRLVVDEDDLKWLKN